MGRKNQKPSTASQKKKNDKKQTQFVEKKSTSTSTKDVAALIQEGAEAFRLLAKSDDVLREPKTQLAYCLDLEWFIEWQEYVGYQAIWAEMDPTEEDTFGKKRPREKNGDLIRKKVTSYHKYPTTMAESAYYNVIQKSDFDSDSVKLVDAETWEYFKAQYPDLVPFPRPMICVDGKPEPAIDLSHVWFGFFDKAVHADILDCGEATNSETDFYDYFHINIADCLQWKMLEDEWIRFYLHKRFEGSEAKRSKLRFRVWRIDSTLNIQSTIEHLNEQILQKTNAVQGFVVTDDTYKEDVRVGWFTKPHTKFLLEVVDAEEDWVLTQHEKSNEIGALCPRVKGQVKGICEKCGDDTALSHQCLCKQNLYCSKRCMYSDKRYHNHTCDIAFDSDSDDELDKAVIESPSPSGLVNLGNTCYMNSGLQCLAATKFLRDFFIRNTYKSQLIKASDGSSDAAPADTLLTRKFAKLLKKMNVVPKAEDYEPWAYKTAFGNFFYQFQGFTQNDTQEFISNMIEIFNEEQEKASKGVEDGASEEGEKHSTAFEAEAIEFVENMKKDLVSDLFCKTFFGVFRSELVCTGCSNSSVNFSAFSSLSLPIAEPRKQEVNLPVFLVRSGITESILDTKVSLPQITGLNLTIEELIRYIAVEKLGLAEEILPRLILTVASGTNITKFFFERHPQKKAAEVLKECSGASNTKFAVIYELPRDVDSYTKDSSIYSVNIKVSGNSIKGVPRPLIVDRTDFVAWIYSTVETMFNLTETLTIASDLIENDSDLRADELLNLAKSDLSADLLINSEKQRTKKKDVCLICSRSSCKHCSVSFDTEDTFDMYISKYKGDPLTFTLALTAEKFATLGIVAKTFTDMGVVSKKNDPSNASIGDCFKLFGEKETLDEENKWDCSKCKKRQIATKQESVYFSPRYLFVQLKRFKVLNKGNKVKNTQAINFAEVEDFSQYIRSAHPSVHAKEGTALLYRLYAVVIHAGSLNEGHYTAYSRTGEVWSYFDDDKVTTVQVEEVVNHKNAYLLFYELVEE